MLYHFCHLLSKKLSNFAVSYAYIDPKKIIKNNYYKLGCYHTHLSHTLHFVNYLNVDEIITYRQLLLVQDSILENILPKSLDVIVAGILDTESLI